MSNIRVERDIPKSRNFGFLLSGIFFLLALDFLHKEYSAYKIYSCIAVGFAVGFIAVGIPKLLTPFYRVWMTLGELMSKVTSPLVMGAIFFLLITPIGLITRLFGRDELRLNKQSPTSYWIDRAPPGASEDIFKNQF